MGKHGGLGPGGSSISFRLTASERKRLDDAKTALQAKKGPTVDVTYRTVILEALGELEKRINDWSRPR